LTNQYYTVY